MVTRVQKWGNSQGLRISKALLRDVEIAVGDEVHVAVEAGKLVIEAVRRPRGSRDLRELVRGIPPKQRRGGELDWGEAVGREAW